jgi:G3E family GTPase
LHFDRNPESTKQVAAADVVVLTKTDVARTGTIDPLRARLHNINRSARMIEAPFGEVNPEQLFRPSRNWTLDESRISLASDANESTPALKNFAAGDGEKRHVSWTYSASLTFDGPVNWVAFGTWLSMLLYARGKDVLRVKGLLDVGEAGPVLLNGVQHVMHPPDHLGEWPDEDHQSRIVFITRSVTSEDLLDSLEAFRGIIGAGPRLLEANVSI